MRDGMGEDARAPQHFYHEDTVVWTGAADDPATVGEAWHDQPDEELVLDGQPRYLQDGEYLIHWPDGRVEVVQDYELELIDRSFQVGDICRTVTPDASSMISGVVVSIFMQVALRCIETGLRLEGWVASKDICASACIRVGDHVIYNNWVGVVEGVFSEALLLPERRGCSFKVYSIGEMGYGRPSDLSLEGMPDVYTDSCKSHAQIKASRAGVVAIRQTVASVAWLAINQKLSSAEQASCEEPKRLWTDFEKLLVVRPFEEHKYAVGDTVVVTEQETRKRLEEGNTDLTDLTSSVMHVARTKSKVEVLWQDGSRTLQSSTTLEQMPTIEDHHVWCGDHVLYMDLAGGEQGAVVQSMDPKEQTAMIVLYSDAGASKTVSLLECKSEGSPDYLHGINRGDIVLISNGATHYPPPSVCTLGKTLDYDRMEELEFEEELVEMGRRLAMQTPRGELTPQVQPRPVEKAHEVDWYGVVVDCASDGSIVIQLPDGRQVRETIDKLNRLVDGFDETDEFDDGIDDEGCTDEEMDAEEAEGKAAHWTTTEGDPLVEPDWEDLTEGDDAMYASDTDKGAEDAVEGQDMVTAADAGKEQGSLALESFKMLEQAPTDHAFLANAHGRSHQKAFLARIQREYRALASSLPDTILVRTYEDRIDLLRAVIVGSQGTPYEDAPFCFDLHLNSNFPTEPPLAHFHSWTRGHGRVSPNLYEEGKVCLSLLNTWQGEQTESWHPGRSSLLQILVSLQGLVLVMEPYFTEPGYEKLAQSELGRRNSQLYSEKAYILSRRFVVHALEEGIQGFEAELECLYRQGSRLASTIARARHLVAQEECTLAPNAEAWSTQLTKGGVLALRRILVELERVQQAAESKATPHFAALPTSSDSA